MSDTRANLGAHRAQQPCADCGAWPKHPHAKTCPTAKRAKSSIRKGKDWERQLVHTLRAAWPGAERRGMYGGLDDVVAGPLFVQAKKVASLYPKRLDALLKDIEPHVPADQYPAVVVAHPGHEQRHKLVVMDLYDFVSLCCELKGRK